MELSENLRRSNLYFLANACTSTSMEFNTLSVAFRWRQVSIELCVEAGGVGNERCEPRGGCLFGCGVGVPLDALLVVGVSWLEGVGVIAAGKRDCWSRRSRRLQEDTDSVVRLSQFFFDSSLLNMRWLASKCSKIMEIKAFFNINNKHKVLPFRPIHFRDSIKFIFELGFVSGVSNVLLRFL